MGQASKLFNGNTDQTLIGRVTPTTEQREFLQQQWNDLAGHLKQAVTAEHYHDLGKYLFGFVFFWGYIAFSQYMLLWYASIPEETLWLARRGATTVPQDVSRWSFVAIAILKL